MPMPLWSIIIANSILALWLAGITYLYIKQQRFFTLFTKDVTKKDLKTVLQNIAESLKTVGEEVNRLQLLQKTMKKEAEKHLQKVGFIRYNPFSDTGGDQSFCFCLLDDKNNGLILTSLHSREQTRLYAKMVKGGQVDNLDLSKEEAEVLKMAMKPGKRSV
jgi:hypothetical protein